MDAVVNASRPYGVGENVSMNVMSSVSETKVRQSRYKQELSQTLEKISADFRIYNNIIIIISFLLVDINVFIN